MKQMSKVLLYLQEHDIRDYGDLEKKAKSSAVKFHALSDAIKEKEARLRDIAKHKMQLINYAKKCQTCLVRSLSAGQFSGDWGDAHQQAESFFVQKDTACQFTILIIYM